MKTAMSAITAILALSAPLCSSAYDEFWIEPKSGTAGSSVSIFGGGFNEVKGKALISSPVLKEGKKFKCKILSWSDEQIIIQVPPQASKEASNYDLEVLDEGEQSLKKLESLFAVSEPSLDIDSIHFREIAQGKKTYAYMSLNGSCLGTKMGKVHILDSNNKKIRCQIYRWEEGFVECRLPAKFLPGTYTFVLETKTGKTQLQFDYGQGESAVGGASREAVGMDYRWRDAIGPYGTPRSVNYLGKTYLFYENVVGSETSHPSSVCSYNNTIEGESHWEIVVGGQTSLHYCFPFLVNSGSDSTVLMVASTDSDGIDASWGLYMHNSGEALENSHWIKICDLASFSPYKGINGSNLAIWPIYDETQKRLHLFYQDSATHATEFKVRSATINLNLPLAQLVKWADTEITIAPENGIDASMTACSALIPKNDQDNIPAAAIAWIAPNTGNKLTNCAFFNFETMSMTTPKKVPLSSRNHECFFANTYDGRICLVVKCSETNFSDVGFAFFDLTKQEWSEECYLKYQAGAKHTSTKNVPTVAVRYIVGKDEKGKSTISLVPWFFYNRQGTLYGIDPIGCLGVYKIVDSGEAMSWALNLSHEEMRKACPLIGVIDGAPPTANTETEDKNTYFSITNNEQGSESYTYSCKVGSFAAIGNKKLGPYMELKAGWTHLYSETKSYSVTFTLKATAQSGYQDKVWLVYLCPVTICDTMSFKNWQGTDITFPYLRFSNVSSPSVAFIPTDRWWSEQQGIKREWNNPETYTSSWQYDGSTRTEPEIASIASVDSTFKSVEVGHTYSKTSQDGFYLGAKVQGAIKDKFSAGVECEMNFTWSYADSKTDKFLVAAQLPGGGEIGEISSYSMAISWFEYANTKGIDNFWCPPDVRTDNFFYNRPWFLTYGTAQIHKE